MMMVMIIDYDYWWWWWCAWLGAWWWWLLITMMMHLAGATDGARWEIVVNLTGERDIYTQRHIHLISLDRMWWQRWEEGFPNELTFPKPQIWVNKVDTISLHQLRAHSGTMFRSTREPWISWVLTFLLQIKNPFFPKTYLNYKWSPSWSTYVYIYLK